MDGDDIDRHGPRWAVRFSLAMHALDPGVVIVFHWLTRVAMLITLLRVPEALSWLV